MKKISFTLLAIIAIFSATAQHISTFDSLGLTPDSYWNGSNLAGGFLDGEGYFTNNYDTTYYSWSGFAYSNVPVNVDTILNGSTDYNYQYSAASGSGALGSAACGISYTGSDDAIIGLKGFAPGHPVYGMMVNNTAYDYLSMTHGDAFAKKFGGATGMDSDWFRLTVTGWYGGAPVANTVNFYLADFRSPDTTQHYVVKTWQFVSLLSLGNVDSLSFTLNSSDTGTYGMNTPAYFAIDNFTTTDGAAVTGAIAVNDSFTFVYMDTLTGNPDTLVANILANDSLPASLSYTVALISSPFIIGATAYLDSSNDLVYIPAQGVTGVDTLYYSLCDQSGTCDTAQILIYILSPQNNVGIMDINIPDLHLYPNPASSYISISYSSAVQAIDIIDMSGRKVLQRELNSNTAAINIASLSPGVYTVMVHTANGISAKRLVKE
jgi:hypothetical protein